MLNCTLYHIKSESNVFSICSSSHCNKRLKLFLQILAPSFFSPHFLTEQDRGNFGELNTNETFSSSSSFPFSPLPSLSLPSKTLAVREESFQS